jgi:hypothetical protein
MLKLALRLIIFCVIIVGCAGQQTNYTKKDIVKITDFELSPDEEKIAFSAITPVGNLDIWVVDMEGKNLRKLTFQDRSPTNHIAKFFKKYHWRNFFEIDMCYPRWTSDGRVVFCQQLLKTDTWSTHTVSRKYWTIDPSGTDKKPQADLDKIIKRQLSAPLNKFKFSDQSEKYKVKILLKDDSLWILKEGAVSPKKLIQ